MKRSFRILIIAVSLTLVFTVAVSSALALPGPFIGRWESTDIDGSYQVLTIGGGPGGAYHVRYYDYGATICGLDPDTGDFLYAASARGTLSASSSVLSGVLPVYCQTAPPSFWGNASFQYTYDSGTDTLTDFYGVVWTRH